MLNWLTRKSNSDEDISSNQVISVGQAAAVVVLSQTNQNPVMLR